MALDDTPRYPFVKVCCTDYLLLFDLEFTVCESAFKLLLRMVP